VQDLLIFTYTLKTKEEVTCRLFMKQITQLSLFIINQVRFRRVVLGISAEKLAELLGQPTSYVRMIERSTNQDQYQPAEYPKLAEALTCTIHDLLPPDDALQKSNSGLVSKKVLSLSKQAGLQLVIKGMMAHGFFDRPKTMDDVAKHLFITEKEQLDVLFDVLDGFVKEGSLKRRLLDYYRSIV
jgi:transcriptional regulator with XRE-family HTH domain